MQATVHPGQRRRRGTDDGDRVGRLSVPDRLCADGGSRALGQILARVKVEIVRWSDQAKALVVLPKSVRSSNGPSPGSPAAAGQGLGSKALAPPRLPPPQALMVD